jgi:hypothetical protein
MRRPETHAICDRCSQRWNHNQLRWQHEYRGPVVMNIRILVCPPCLDKIQEQLRAIVLPADPVPVINARPMYFDDAETDYRAVASAPQYDPITGLPLAPTSLRVTQDCSNRTMLPYGSPTGLDANGQMPLQTNAGNQPQAFNVRLPILSVFASGCTVTVTCSAPHGLQPNAQVSVTGLGGSGNGFFSVGVPTATVFTYQTTEPVNPSLTSTTRMATAQVGLPRGTTTIPVTYGAGPGAGAADTIPGPPTDVIAS